MQCHAMFLTNVFSSILIIMCLQPLGEETEKEVPIEGAEGG